MKPPKLAKSNVPAKRDSIVVKENSLNEARYRLTLQEQRILAIMISDISQEDKDFKKYTYRVKDLIDWLGISDKGYYKKIRDITRNLLKKELIIYNRQERTILQTSWLISAKYYLKDGTVELMFHPDLKPYLLQLKECFTQYDLKNVLRLRSKYAFRLYELLKQYESAGKRRFQLEELRSLLGLEENELKQWVHFRTKVLDKAKQEINEKTDLRVDYQVEKEGHKISYVVFTIRKPSEPDDSTENLQYEAIIEMVPEKFRKLKTIQGALKRALKVHGFEYCRRNVEYAGEKAKNNYRTFLIKALQEDWGRGWWEEKLAREEDERLLSKIKSAGRIKIGDRVYSIEDYGNVCFARGENGAVPINKVVELVKLGKAEILS